MKQEDKEIFIKNDLPSLIKLAKKQLEQEDKDIEKVSRKEGKGTFEKVLLKYVKLMDWLMERLGLVVE